jgi:hypothetical protein
VHCTYFITGKLQPQLCPGCKRACRVCCQAEPGPEGCVCSHQHVSQRATSSHGGRVRVVHEPEHITVLLKHPHSVHGHHLASRGQQGMAGAPSACHCKEAPTLNSCLPLSMELRIRYHPRTHITPSPKPAAGRCHNRCCHTMVYWAAHGHRKTSTPPPPHPIPYPLQVHLIRPTIGTPLDTTPVHGFQGGGTPVYHHVCVHTGA